MKRAIALLLMAAAACTRPTTRPLVDPDLAAHIPATAAMVAGLDVDRLRDTPLYARLPENFRDASYVLAAFDPPNLVTVSRVKGRVVATTPATNSAPDLLRHAADTPLWIVARGDTPLPLAGNLANINTLLRQTEYTRLTGRVGERVEFAAEGVCRDNPAAEHLEQNIRAIATLAKLPLEVRRDGATVHVTGSADPAAFARLF